MTLRDVMKKGMLPVALILLWAWLAKPFYMEAGGAAVWKMWMILGFPFGIHRMSIWLVPWNYDIGGTVVMWFLNVLAGCLIGGGVIVWYFVRAAYVLTTYLISVVWRALHHRIS